MFACFIHHYKKSAREPSRHRKEMCTQTHRMPNQHGHRLLYRKVPIPQEPCRRQNLPNEEILQKRKSIMLRIYNPRARMHCAHQSHTTWSSDPPVRTIAVLSKDYSLPGGGNRTRNRKTGNRTPPLKLESVAHVFDLPGTDPERVLARAGSENSQHMGLPKQRKKKTLTSTNKAAIKEKTPQV